MMTFGLLSFACAKAIPPGPVALPEQPPQAEPAEEAVDPTPEPVPLPQPASAPPLPQTWRIPEEEPRSFAEAITAARALRGTFDAKVTSFTPGRDGGAPSSKDFERVNVLVDQTSRKYATAYHAPDATPATRVDSLREAAAMILAWSRRLDEAGLSRAPAGFRSDPSLSLTFEDVANGPAKRWREEGLALVGLCVDMVRGTSIDTPATRDCASLKQAYAAILTTRAKSAPLAPPRPKPEAAGCACDPGDPLCSASMSGWCRPAQ